mmetsp:Transcript_48019/g.83719  ORF Transcript_48019/g.83719 Transcript_48019/m.83719 type:complete len:506 (+) Transcript_48019:63-1580(+)
MRTWALATVLTSSIAHVAGVCGPSEGNIVLTETVSSEGDQIEVSLQCGEDPAAAAARLATSRRTRTTNPDTVVSVARKFESALPAKAAAYKLPDELDAKTAKARPRVLKTGGMYSRRAAEHGRKQEFAAAIADLVRALLRPNLDPSAQDKLTSLLSDQLNKAEQERSKASSDGDLSELFEEMDMEDKGEDNAEIDRGALKNLYRKLSVKYHPDKNAAAAARFNRIRDAYEILSDPVKTLLYDTAGMEAVRKFEGGGSDLERTENDETRVYVTLEEAYNGMTKKVKHGRQVVCRSCRLRPNLPRCRKCRQCPGKVELRRRWINPQQFMQEEVEVPSKEKCSHESTEVEVIVDRGVSVGERVNFPGLATQLPGQITGDFQVSIWLTSHHLFKRVGSDLIITVQVSLYEALLGFTREIKHLDGHMVKFGVEKGEVLRPGMGLEIEDEGMPLREDPTSFGKLIVKFEIEFPKTIPVQAADALETALRNVGLGPKQARVTKSFKKSKSEL